MSSGLTIYDKLKYKGKEKINVYIISTQNRLTPGWLEFDLLLQNTKEIQSIKQINKLIKNSYTKDPTNWQRIYWKTFAVILVQNGSVICSVLKEHKEQIQEILGAEYPSKGTGSLNAILKISAKFVRTSAEKCKPFLDNFHVFFTPFDSHMDSLKRRLHSTLLHSPLDPNYRIHNINEKQYTSKLHSADISWLKNCRNLFEISNETPEVDEGVAHGTQVKNREWLREKLSVAQVKDVLGISPDEYIDRFLIRLHLHEPKHIVYDNFVTIFGYDFDEVIDEILAAWPELRAHTYARYAPFLAPRKTPKVNLPKPIDFSMQYKPEQHSLTDTLSKGLSKVHTKNDDGQYNMNWLVDIASFLPLNGIARSHGELAGELLQMLSSNNSNEELMQLLCELFGYDQTEVLFKLMEHREALIMTIKSEKIKNKQQKQMTKVLNRPTIASQVIVQSAEEKRLRKEIRKEEKKLKSRQEAINNNSRCEEDIDVLLPMLDRIELKQRRQVQLSTEPLLTRKSDLERTRPSALKEECRNVYASNNTKNYGTLLLAEGTEIKSHTLYKQVNIPATKSTPETVFPKENLIKVSSMDILAKSIFSSITQLNVIQSIVYESAYTSNENLLICAPTGAGKTNIALLTIAKCLQSYVVGTSLQDTNFKIIYVAPMKALASEMTNNFSKKLRGVGVKVRELTGDMQLSKSEIVETQILVTTPEKWDVVTRKPDSETGLTRLVRLLIIDEIHLLNGDRGHVLEALVARTLRLVESTQLMIRIVGLSATLPNYRDVARFLKVNLQRGLFYFDQRFRPVPLATTFVGCKDSSTINVLDFVCYEQVIEALREGHQVMVFVHTRRGTVQTAEMLRITASQKGQLSLFESPQSGSLVRARQLMNNSSNRELRELFTCGLSVHHAGMLRHDRNHVEKFFMDGHIRVLVCTATLAWGVNLPAHTVIIKGTDVYMNGQNTDLDILDVQQIFGRAGRPQFDTSGHAVIITPYKKLDTYLRLITNQVPIESGFVKHLADNLNAEIVLGTVTTVEEAVMWLSYTYLYIRMRINPLVYGINYYELETDANLVQRRRAIVEDCAKKLDSARLIRYNSQSGDLISTEYGRIASHFYIKYDTIELFNDMMKREMTEIEILHMITCAQEFEQLRIREEEVVELRSLHEECKLLVKDINNVPDKVSILLQAFLSRIRIQTSSLSSDMNYIVQNIPRIARGLFEIFLQSNNALMAGKMLKFALMFDNHQWDFETPLRQFGVISFESLDKIERNKLSVEKMKDMPATDIGGLIRNKREGTIVKKCAESIPLLEIETTLMPITKSVLRMSIDVTARFQWESKFHGTAQAFWLWIEDPEYNNIYHYEYFVMTKKLVLNQEPVHLFVTIPLIEPTPSQYYVRILSDRWLGAENYECISFNQLMLPCNLTRDTDLEDLMPLATSVLNNDAYQSLYNFNYLNPIQTQMFHVLYHTDQSILLGAPTGSGKTIIAELAILRLFNTQPTRKAVYVAPLKALVRERVADWQEKFRKINKIVVEVTGDAMPDKNTLEDAHIIITTPEKWDIVSRNWESRCYVQAVGLLILDEVHLLGEDRGPVLEAIVSRTNFIASRHSIAIRMMGLSTAIANAYDLAGWLGVPETGLYNFRPAVRPVPLEVHISGYPGKHYCPRMALMNKPTFQAIREHAPRSPTIVFVSSRRQTRVTALDLINFLGCEDDSKQWLHMDHSAIEYLIEAKVVDENLKHTLLFGIGVHHAGLLEGDRKLVEELFYNQQIQVIVATATLAWGVNFPAHLVVIKGTEYYDGKQRRYVDMPITDVLQMIGRAGRPQFDETGVAVVLVHDIRKNFYRKFLYEPFPVESHMLEVLPNHMSAEIASGTITSKRVAYEYITWTYMYRRLLHNPSYYQLCSLEDRDVHRFLVDLVANTVTILVESDCCIVDEDGEGLSTTIGARVGANYYLSYQTVKFLSDKMHSDISTYDLLRLMCDTYEFSQVPVRHNEDLLNANLARMCKIPVKYDFETSHTKTFLLLQAHIQHLEMPCTDYITDLKLVLEQTGRVLQAIAEYSTARGWMAPAIRVLYIMQMLSRALWIDDSPYLQLPHMTFNRALHMAKSKWPEKSTQQLHMRFPKFVIEAKISSDRMRKALQHVLPDLRVGEVKDIMEFIEHLQVPTVRVRLFHLSSGQQWDGKNLADGSLILEANSVYNLEVTLCWFKKRRVSPKVGGSRRKQEGWSILFGCVEPNVDTPPIAVKKLVAGGFTSSNSLRFTTPGIVGNYSYKLMVISDSYMGLDQETDYNLQVGPKTSSNLD